MKTLRTSFSSSATDHPHRGSLLQRLSLGWLLVCAALAQAASPTFTVQPQSQVVTVGADVTLTAEAGAPAPAFQWRKNGVAITNATNASLSLTAVQVSDAGVYSVSASNGVDAPSLSEGASLVVLSSGAPTLITFEPGQGYTLGLQGSAIKGVSPGQWVLLPSAGDATIVNAAAIPGFGTQALQMSYSGDYAAYALLENPGIGTAATYSVQVRTGTTTYPFGNDGAVAFYRGPVANSNTVVASVNFSRNNASRNIVISGIGVTTGTLTLPTAYVSGATYMVVLKVDFAGNLSTLYVYRQGTGEIWNGSSAGTGTEKRYVVSMHGGSDNLYPVYDNLVAAPFFMSSPAITTQPQAQSVTVGGSASFTVVATGSPAPSYVWRKDGSALPGQTNATLTLSDVQASDAGAYSVIVSNGVEPSVTSQDAALTVNPAPVIRRTVGAGSRYSLFLKSPGALWGMGRNASGELGFSGVGLQFSAVQLAADIKAFAAGLNHSLAIKTNGDLWTSGHNVSGQLGDGSTTGRPNPVLITSGVSSAIGGYFHSLIIKDDGSLWAFGDNSSGQLGDDSTTNRSVPVKIVASGVRSASAGNWHSMFVKSDNTLWAMGANDSGQLGNGNTTNRSQPVQVMSDVAYAACGWFYSLIVKTDGTLLAVGNNEGGQLGDGTIISRTAPVQVATNVAFAAAGFKHSMFIKKDGTLWAMGDNAFGQLGDATNASRLTPVQVASNVVAVAVGFTHSIFEKADGTVWTFGENDSGQLGDGSSNNRAAPAVVETPAPVAPTITTAPLGKTVAVGGYVAFSVVAAGTQPLKYQWLLGGTPIAGAIASELTLSNLQVQDGGMYSVRIVNFAGEVTSTPVSLSVVPASQLPTIQTQPSSTTVNAGQPASFSVVAAGENLTYQWKKTGSVIPGATAATYSIAAAQLSDMGDYTVVVSIGANSVTSDIATLTVQTGTIPPYLTSMFWHKTAVAGSTFNFPVTAAGSDPIFYQWKKNGASLSNGDRISGTGSATLVIGDVQLADAGAYTLTLTNGAGNYTTSEAKLTVAAVAPANDNFAGATAIAAFPATLSGSNVGASKEAGEPDHGHVVGGPHPMAHGDYSVWWKWTAAANGAYAVNTAGSTFEHQMVVYTGTAVNALTRVSTGRWGAGNGQTLSFFASAGTTYYLALEGFFGATGDIALKVESIAGIPPKITGHPAGQLVTTGSEVTFNVSADGSDPLSYQWRKNGTAITGATNATYNIASVAAGDAGDYSVVVSNQAGTATSVAGHMVVDGTSVPAFFRQPLADQQVLVGSPVYYYAEVLGTGPFTFVWKKDGVAIPGATDWSYTINNAALGDSGQYTCTVAGAAGDPATSNTSVLTVTAGAPTISTQPAAQVVNVGQTATFAVSAAGTPPLSYQWKKGDTTLSGATNATLQITNAQVADAGSYTVTVSNSGGFVVSAAASLTVRTSPVFGSLLQVSPASPKVGDTIVITGSATGTAPITYEWRKDGVALQGNTRITGVNTGTLTIASATTGDTGFYTLAATNAVATTVSEVARVDVVEAGPVITQHPADWSWIAGAEASFSIVASGKAPLTYAWYFTPKNGNTPQKLSDSAGKISGSSTANLRIASVAAADEGDYVCEVGDGDGIKRTSAAARLQLVTRALRLLDAAGSSGANVNVTVLLSAVGNENGLGFSVLFDATKLTFVSATLGADGDGAALNVNASQAASGKVGIGMAKAAGTTYTAGTRAIVTITWQIGASVAAGTLMPLTFGDTPISREVVSDLVALLPTTYMNGSVSIPSGYEADMNGNGSVTIADWVKVGRIVAGLDTVANGIDYMKADCAPRSTLGNGTLSISDWVQAGRYAAGLDPLTTAGGASGPNIP